MKGVKHYKKDGTEWKGATHKMPNGQLHTGKTHGKTTMRKRLFNKIKAGTKGGKAGQWSGRKAQMLAKQYKAAGGGYK